MTSPVAGLRVSIDAARSAVVLMGPSYPPAPPPAAADDGYSTLFRRPGRYAASVARRPEVRMRRRSFAHLALPVAVAAVWCGGVAALAACNGGSATLRALPTGAPPPSGAPTSAPTLAPSSNGGLFAGIAPAASGSLSSPTPLPTPASGTYTLAGLATYLDASNRPAAGAPVGLIGIVTALTTSSVTVTQLPMIAPNDANGNAIPYVNNVPQIGSFATPVTVDVDSNTTFANAVGLAKLV